MEGLAIVDASTGRRILGTHFGPSQALRAALSIDSALATTDSIAWVPSLEGHTGAEDSSDDDEEHEGGQGWSKTSRRAGGQAVCQVERNGLRYIAPIAADGELLPLLRQVHS